MYILRVVGCWMCVRIEEYTRMGLNNDHQYTMPLPLLLEQIFCNASVCALSICSLVDVRTGSGTVVYLIAVMSTKVTFICHCCLLYVF